MTTSVFDLFKIGIGPSSSHTVGPMRAAARFAAALVRAVPIDRIDRLKVELFGSLGATGRGHGSDQAIVLGLEGADPETVDVDAAPRRADEIRATKRLRLAGTMEIPFDTKRDLVLYRHRSLDFHSNGMVFTAFGGADELFTQTYFSVGGGFIVEGAQIDHPVDTGPALPYEFASGADLLQHCDQTGLSVADVMLANECARRSSNSVEAGLDRIWQVMRDCVELGLSTEGVLPGGLQVRRRAAALHRRLLQPEAASDPLDAADWLAVWAMAVNEQNAAGGRVVTAPTNGAAGIIPAVLHYVIRFLPSADDHTVREFLLTSGAIGAIYQQTASISGAEVGCQGEVGVACSMAAAALCHVMGGTPRQVLNAAEIGLEHNLGLTCDPVGGLVQVPCIERNSLGAVKAVMAARLAKAGDGRQVVSLDQVITTMMQTGADMKAKYKETSRGGLAVNIVEC